MERVEPFQSVKVVDCALFSVLRSVTLDFRCHTMFHMERLQISEVVHKIAQNCEDHIYGVSCAIPKRQNGLLCSI